MIEQLTDSIVARLKVAMPGWDAEDFPDVPDRFPWTKRDRSLLVSYEGSTFSADAESLDPQSSDRATQIAVTVLTRSLRGGYGMANALELVRRALFGWEPVGADAAPLGWARLVVVSDRFVSEEQGVWRFVVVFRTSSVVVASTEPLVTVPFTEIELEGVSPCE